MSLFYSRNVVVVVVKRFGWRAYHTLIVVLVFDKMPIFVNLGSNNTHSAGKLHSSNPSGKFK
jgi:hypothetical protein